MIRTDCAGRRVRNRCRCSWAVRFFSTAALFGALTAQAQVDFATAEINIWPVRDGVYMLVGPVGNSTVQIGDDGVLIVDTQFAELGARILAAIRQLSDQPIRYVVNTHAHGDHIGANAEISRAGNTIAGGTVAGAIADAGIGAAIVAHENALFGMLEQESPPPFEALPTDTYFTDRKDLYFNGEAVRLIHQAAAHTNGDSIVHFRRSDVISAGDIFVTTGYPFIDAASGGTIDGIIDGLNAIIGLAVPEEKQEGGTYIVPGHGRLADEADVVEYRDMLTIIRDRVQAMLDEGLSLRQTQAASPTRDYDARYGSDSGFWTTEQFVAAIYNHLRLEAD
jgi:glyoxylase-like metal-dependent hydrolase (beta-lactamase superfamily II)